MPPFDLPWTSSPPCPPLNDQSGQNSVDSGEVDEAQPLYANPFALAPHTGGLAECCHWNRSCYPKAAGGELAAYRHAIIDREKRKPRLALTGAVFHHGGTEIA